MSLLQNQNILKYKMIKKNHILFPKSPFLLRITYTAMSLSSCLTLHGSKELLACVWEVESRLIFWSAKAPSPFLEKRKIYVELYAENDDIAIPLEHEEVHEYLYLLAFLLILINITIDVPHCYRGYGYFFCDDEH